MLKKTALTLGALSLLSGAAMAQTAAPTTAPAAPVPAMTYGTMGGMTMADTATMGVKFVDVKPADIMSSKLVGTNVYNKQNENLGEIEDLVIENGKAVTGVVVSVGGFLGMGERYVVLDPSTIAVSHKDNKWMAHVDTTKDNLKNAPTFNYQKKS